MTIDRDTDARFRSDARAHETGCLPAIAAIFLGAVIAYIAWRIFQ